MGCSASVAADETSAQQENHDVHKESSKASPDAGPTETPNDRPNGRTSGANAWNDNAPSVTVEEHAVSAMDGAGDRESPETRRVANKKTSRGQPGFITDEITTIEDNDDAESPVKKKGWGEERESKPSPPIPKPKPPPPRKPQDEQSYEDRNSRPSTLLMSKSTKDEQVLTLSRFGDKAPLADGLDESLGRLAPTGINNRPPPPGGNKSGFKAASPNRYDIDLSDDEDEKKAFDLERFCKFYKWNKNKPSDLLDFLWRNFDNKQYSMLCFTYKDQDSIFAGFQGANVAHGLFCRLEKLGMEYFGCIQTLYRPSRQDTHNALDSFKVLGVFILPGSDVPRQVSSLPDFQDFQILKADTKDPLIRQFVGKIIVGTSPVQEFQSIAYSVSHRAPSELRR